MGDEYTIRGSVVVPEVTRIDLFDGSFKSGFRLKEIRIAPAKILDTAEYSVRLTTEDTGHRVDWNWADNLEVGWAAWNIPIASRYGEFFWVDRDCTIIEDLYLDPSGVADETLNYTLVLERVTMSGGMGALNMVRNRSQG